MSTATATATILNFHQFNLKVDQNIVLLGRRGRRIEGVIESLESRKAIVLSEGKLYNVPYSIIVETGEINIAARDARLAKVAAFVMAKVGETVELLSGSRKGDQFKVTKVNQKRYVATALNGDGEFTLPFEAVKVVSNQEDTIIARRAALVELGVSMEDVLAWEKKYL